MKELARFFFTEDSSNDDFGKFFSGYLIKNTSAISINDNHLFVGLFVLSLALIAFILTRPQEFYQRLDTEVHEDVYHQDDHQTRFRRFASDGKVIFIFETVPFLPMRKLVNRSIDVTSIFKNYSIYNKGNTER